MMREISFYEDAPVCAASSNELSNLFVSISGMISCLFGIAFALRDSGFRPGNQSAIRTTDA